MNIDSKYYVKYANKKASKSKVVINSLKAFLSGGVVCIIGELINDIYLRIGMSAEITKTLVPVTMVVIAAILTGFGVYDRIAKHAGAGTIVPITGFGNAVVSPALDNKSEGMIMGLGAKIFIIAGPVILYGTLTSVIYGIIYYISGLVKW
jgi:stage V sporulation protein AC